MTTPDQAAETARVLTAIRERVELEEQAIATARALPAIPGPCPGIGLRTRPNGGYRQTLCPVCSAVLGPWDWQRAAPYAVEHDRRA
jgi:hypothetical protein